MITIFMDFFMLHCTCTWFLIRITFDQSNLSFPPTYRSSKKVPNHKRQNRQNDLCAQRRRRSAWASAQSDQSLRYVLNGYLRTNGVLMRTANTLIRLCGRPGGYESSLDAWVIMFVLSCCGSIICFCSKSALVYALVYAHDLPLG